MFCYQRKYYSEVEVINSYDQLKDILNDESIARTITIARQHLTMGNEKEYQMFKRQLPLFIFQCDRFEESTNSKGVKGHWRTQKNSHLNGLCVLDIDHIDNPMELWGKCCKDHPYIIEYEADHPQWHVVLAYITPSGHGLKIVFVTNPVVGNLADNQREFSKWLGIENDEAIKDSSRGSFATTANDVLFINPAALIGYNNPQFDEKYGNDYRNNDSRPKSKGKKQQNKQLAGKQLSLGLGGELSDEKKQAFNQNPNSDVSNNDYRGNNHDGGSAIDTSVSTIHDDVLDAAVTSLSSSENGGMVSSNEGGGSIDSSNTGDSANDSTGHTTGNGDGCELLDNETSIENISDNVGDTEVDKGDELKYGDTKISEIASRYEGKYGKPVKGDRHRSLIKVAGHFRYLVDNDAQKLKVALRSLSWVREWEQEETNTSEIDAVADDVCGYRMWRELPKALAAILNQYRGQNKGGSEMEDGSGESIVCHDSSEIYERLRPLLENDPLYSLCTAHLPNVNKIAGIFVSGAMFATLASRIHYLHYDGRQHRLNPQVFIIGKPASGKSFADELDNAIMAVMRAADEPGRKAELEYKREQKKRKTSNKAGKGEKQMDEPQVCIRYIPSRTSNNVFYRRQTNAKELVDGEIMPLHLYTFDSELDSSVTAQSGGAWIAKHDLELKAFHNEFSGVDYANSDSINEVIQVFWNQVVTGTDVSLAKKINMRNVNDGLCSRIAICRIVSDDFTMIEKGDYTERSKNLDLMKRWGQRFDALKGELFVPKLVEHCYKLCEKAALSAKEKNDHVLDYFRKRAVFYAEWFTIPRILARAIIEHEVDENVNIMRPVVTKEDLMFAEVIYDTVIYYQDIFFGKMLEDVWQNAQNEFIVRKATRVSRNEELFDLLNKEFNLKDVQNVLRVSYDAARSQATRWLKRGLIIKMSRNSFKKK